jgi:predicted ATP-grasp superfamily ATP-dependent carboligase
MHQKPFGFHICIIVSATPHLTAVVIDSLPRDLRFFLIGPKDIALFRHSRRCVQYFAQDLSLQTAKATSFVRIVEDILKKTQIVCIIPVDDSANRIVHSTQEKLDVKTYPMPDSMTFERLNDKWSFYKQCRELQIQSPQSFYFAKKSDIVFDQLVETIGLPFVVKPTNKFDGIGVVVIRSKDQFQTEIVCNSHYNFWPLIVQTYITGVDVDISLLAIQGVIKNFAIQTMREKFLVFERNAKLEALAETLVRELNYTGLMHIDARLDEESKDIFLIECNPRFWGSLDRATCCGLNFVRAGLHVTLGSPDPLTIAGVSSPPVGQILREIAKGKQSYRKLSREQRLRIRRTFSLSFVQFWRNLLLRPHVRKGF